MECYKTFKFIALISIILPWIIASIPTNDSPFSRRHVQIFHNISSGESFTIHCKSKDDDLGEHVIGPGQMYEFKFHSHILGNTLFSCKFRVEDMGGTYDIYVDKREAKRCPTYCRWYVIVTGVIGRRQVDQAADIYYPFT